MRNAATFQLKCSRTRARAAGGEARAPRRIFEQGVDRLRERLRIAGWHQRSGIAHDLGERRLARRHHRHAARHGFAGGQAEAFVEGRHDGDRARIALHERFPGQARAELHRAVETELGDAIAGVALFAQFADYEELQFWSRPAQAGKGLEKIAEALQGLIRARDGHEQILRALDLGHRTEAFGVDAVVDHVDGGGRCRTPTRCRRARRSKRSQRGGACARRAPASR